jgi:hypothetical protein
MVRFRVLTKTATFVENIWHAAGTEIEIAERHFSEEVHTLLETLGIEKEPVPVAPIANESAHEETS